MNLNELPDMSAAYKQVQEKKNNDGNLANNAVPYDKVTKADIITGAKGKDEQGGKKKPKGHDCAKQVKYEGKEYTVIPEAHTLLEDGTVTHYDIEDAEYIYENVPVEDLEILISEKHEHFANYDKNAEVLGEAMSSYDKNRKRAAQRAADRNAARAAGKTGVVPGVGYVTARKEKETYTDEKGTVRHKSGAKNEAFAFSEADFAELETLGEEIDSLTDEQLIDVMEDIILEMAQDDQDLIEICEHLEGVEMLSEEKTKQLELKLEPSRMDRLKGAAKKAGEKVGAAAKAAGSAAKKGIKAAGKSVSKNAGKAVGEFQAARIKAKRASMEKTPAKSKSSDDGTDGKLDSVLSSIRKSKGTSSSSSSSSDSGSSSSGGGESSSSSSSAPAKKPGLLRRAAGAIGRGLKKAVGKTARAVSGGSDKLAKRLGEDYDKIAHLYESGLFSLEEIETVIEEGYKELPKNKMFRKAGNLGRDVVSPSVTDDQRQKAYGRSKKIIKVMNKETQKQERGEK
ncbi:cytidyltransferase [Synechococcus phage S-MbCM100]|uniref:Gp185 n=2 Tax=Acionnavirus monteraybay TaxID=2734078 RepID=A0A0E3ES81_9CAUD|nr:cytidyltransferase [Synechococcus phage S-MbCM100]AIX14345.1 hypothetical protein Syn7803C42_160 [Synechococcus phage ACG-2014a]AHB81016.1 ribonucleotide reductase A [Synechococcus phage S-MbCM100]AIX15210.1 hypothetical protein Syn7803C47_161 [Synechococcus phage ACG-2014a]AIX15856.1 hypothetical protein Syn7803C53_159 [Synechococcus phage ACG-2014a]AIX23637.1 hypothetical protein Syn7803US101_158 [Synechococcus phage ACG-2014a]